ncbi:MAG TPA: DUF4389 domain-containing protein [Euzebyales bacterium]
MTATRVTVIVLGAISGLIGLALVAAGLALLVFDAAGQDDDGYFTSPSYQLSTDGYAITSEDIDLRVEADPAGWVPDFGDVSARVTVVPEGASDEVFVGIGPKDDVDRYLGGVSHDVITRLGDDPDEVAYGRIDGDRVAEPPDTQTFWDASSTGAGEQTITWDVRSGNWAVVVMAADASPGFAVEATTGVATGILSPVGIALLVFGLLALGGAIALLIAATVGAADRAPGERVAVGAPMSSADRIYPVMVEARLDKPSRGLWIVKWLLLIPHYIVLALLWIAFALLTLVAGIAILITGRYPRGIFMFTSGVLRWSWRVGYYGYSALATDRYPPFTLADVPDYPARLHIEEPGPLSRGLVLIKWWLLAIPHYIVLGVLVGNGVTWTTADAPVDRVQVAGGGLIIVLVMIAAFALLFTGRYPRGLYDFVMGLNRWVYRVVVYIALMTDEYPPFRLDGGETEPAPPSPPPPDDEPSVAGRVDDRPAQV